MTTRQVLPVSVERDRLLPVALFTRVGGAFEVLPTPRAESFENRIEDPAVPGDGVNDLGWHLRVSLTMQDPVGFQLAESLGHHLLRCFGNAPTQFTKPERTVPQVVKNQGFPAPPHDSYRAGNRAVLGGKRGRSAHRVQVSKRCLLDKKVPPAPTSIPERKTPVLPSSNRASTQ